jgi:hypothetical protein
VSYFETLQRNKENTIVPVIYSLEIIFVFDTCNLFLNVPYKMNYRDEPTALSRNWKETATAIPVSVSKLYVTFCGAAAKLRARVTVC